MASDNQIRKFRKLRAIEKLLVSEYEESRAEFVRIQKDALPAYSAKDAIERCTEAMRRLRKFLGDGEIPPDIEEKLAMGVE